MQKLCVLVQSTFFSDNIEVLPHFNLFVLLSVLVCFYKNVFSFSWLKEQKIQNSFFIFLNSVLSQNQTNKLKQREYLLVVNKKLIQKNGSTLQMIILGLVNTLQMAHIHEA